MTVEGGSIACQRRHTTGLDLVEALDGGIRTYLARTGRIGSTIQSLREIDLRRAEKADHLIVEAGRRGLFPWSKLGKVEEAWRKPPFPEFESRDGWSLYNSFTEVAKGFSMKNEMAACDQVRQLILTAGPSNGGLR